MGVSVGLNKRFLGKQGSKRASLRSQGMWDLHLTLLASHKRSVCPIVLLGPSSLEGTQKGVYRRSDRDLNARATCCVT